MAGTEFSQAQWQVFVRAQTVVKNLDMTRAVHRLNREIAFFRLSGKHIVAIIFPVTGFLPQGAIHNQRSFYFLVTPLILLGAHVLLDLLPQSPTFGMPEHHTRRFILQVEQIKFLRQFAVIAFGRLFEQIQIGF